MKITSVNVSVGQWSDGLPPIKKMDEPTLAAFSHTHTHTLLVLLHPHTDLQDSGRRKQVCHGTLPAWWFQS